MPDPHLREGRERPAAAPPPVRRVREQSGVRRRPVPREFQGETIPGPRRGSSRQAALGAMALKFEAAVGHRGGDHHLSGGALPRPKRRSRGAAASPRAEPHRLVPVLTDRIERIARAAGELGVECDNNRISCVRVEVLPGEYSQALRLLLAGSSYKFRISQDLLLSNRRPHEDEGDLSGALPLMPWFLADEVQWWSHHEATRGMRVHAPFGTWTGSCGGPTDAERRRQAPLRRRNAKTRDEALARRKGLLDLARPIFENLTMEMGRMPGHGALRQAMDESGRDIEEREARWLVKHLKRGAFTTARASSAASWPRRWSMPRPPWSRPGSRSGAAPVRVPTVAGTRRRHASAGAGRGRIRQNGRAPRGLAARLRGGTGRHPPHPGDAGDHVRLAGGGEAHRRGGADARRRADAGRRGRQARVRPARGASRRSPTAPATRSCRR